MPKPPLTIPQLARRAELNEATTRRRLDALGPGYSYRVCNVRLVPHDLADEVIGLIRDREPAGAA